MTGTGPTARRGWPFTRGRLMGLLLAGLACTVAATLVLAYFNSTRTAAATITTIRIFEGERTTPAFAISDSSSGTAVDGSSPTAFAGDGLLFTTSNWSTAYAADRYLELDFNTPLAASTPASGMTFTFDFSSAAGGQTSCMYFEVRRASTGAVRRAELLPRA